MTMESQLTAQPNVQTDDDRTSPNQTILITDDDGTSLTQTTVEPRQSRPQNALYCVASLESQSFSSAY